MKRTKKKLGRTAKRPDGTVDLQVARAEKITSHLQTLVQRLIESIAQQVANVLELYRTWERANPDGKITPGQRMEMIRLGFVGPGGFDRCHEDGRLPRASWPWSDRIHDDDRAAADLMMCPALESQRCEPIWRAMGTAPCELLLLEVYQAVGIGTEDLKVNVILEDLGRTSPDKYRETFSRAKELVRKAEAARKKDEM